MENGLHGVDGLDFPPNARRHYVAVVPCDTEPRVAAPRKYFKDRGQQSGKPDEVFPVSHRPIDTDTLFSPT